MEKLIKRDFYMDQLIRSMHNSNVKVITGLRRSGKSVLLFDLFYNYLKNQGVKEDQIIKIQLDQRRDFKYRNPIVLCDYIESIVKDNPDKNYFLLIDEVQLTQKVVDKEYGEIEITIYDMLNELKNYKNLDVYVTGSNSKGLSSDIATEFRGRATQIKMYPLSFSEYYSYYRGNKQEALNNYILYGGMPGLLNIEDERDKKNYLSALYNELYIRDIVERNKIEQEELLNELLDFLASQIGSLTNSTKIANTLSSEKRQKINPSLISSYLQNIIDSFLIEKVQRFDVKGKKYFKYPNKYYYTDIGLRNARLNYRQYDPGHIMENIIYNELIRRGYSVDVGVINDRRQKQNKQREIDFVVNDNDKKVYIQCALRIETEEKEESEISSLLLSQDFFKKVVIRMDIPHSFYDKNGIFHVNLIEFLLGKVDLF